MGLGLATSRRRTTLCARRGGVSAAATVTAAEPPALPRPGRDGVGAGEASPEGDGGVEEGDGGVDGGARAGAPLPPACRCSRVHHPSGCGSGRTVWGRAPPRRRRSGRPLRGLGLQRHPISVLRSMSLHLAPNTVDLPQSAEPGSARLGRRWLFRPLVASFGPSGLYRRALFAPPSVATGSRRPCAPKAVVSRHNVSWIRENSFWKHEAGF